MFTVAWDQHERHLLSIHDVERLLDELHVDFSRTDPTLVTVELSESGASLAIGLGRERSVLNYISGSKDPPYFTSRGAWKLTRGSHSALAVSGPSFR